MFLSKRSNGYYYIYFDNNLGKRNKVSTNTKFKKEAYEFLTRFSKEYHSKYVSGIENINLETFTKEYYKFSTSIHRPKTTKEIKSILKEFSIFLNNPLLSKISGKGIRKYLVHKSKTSNYTAQKHLAYLRSAFNYAKRNKYIETNPFNEIDNFRIPQKQPNYFSEKEYKILLGAVDNPQLKNIIEIAANTGMRQMEILTLKWNQINFSDRYIILDNKEHVTKGKRVRSIPMNARVLQILTDLEKNMNGEYVFSKEGEPYKQDYISKSFKKYVRKVNINQKLNFHSLRHSFASWLVQKNVTIFQIQSLLGHADIKTTKVYTHLRSEDLRNSVDLLSV